MSLQIINFQGVPHIVTPYQKGTYIREDAFWRQFRISCSGELSFMEDNPIFGTWQISYGFFLGERGGCVVGGGHEVAAGGLGQ